MNEDVKIPDSPYEWLLDYHALAKTMADTASRAPAEYEWAQIRYKEDVIASESILESLQGEPVLIAGPHRGVRRIKEQAKAIMKTKRGDSRAAFAEFVGAL